MGPFRPQQGRKGFLFSHGSFFLCFSPPQPGMLPPPTGTFCLARGTKVSRPNIHPPRPNKEPLTDQSTGARVFVFCHFDFNKSFFLLLLKRFLSSPFGTKTFFIVSPLGGYFCLCSCTFSRGCSLGLPFERCIFFPHTIRLDPPPGRWWNFVVLSFSSGGGPIPFLF